MSKMSDALVVERDSIHLRRHATAIMDKAKSEGYRSVSLANVEFVSRSVADELIHLSEEYDIDLEYLDGDVGEMVEAVSYNLSVVAD